ncbi:hypothetical protein GS397_27700 (plasmid) [Sphingobium yanoikuyae]|uniref:Uncharacterized protein n=1 Tax=Sphingobium yanoikuyae TaxID=13690 RepID=A0A6P1GQG6_SPHYA|nr:MULTISPECIES: hypothetical protein [Sphingobium]QHD70886.1 hypothetical protein GS397_27700 [Sphingobium yanoikuyae]WDA39592.1 hypothetical protein PO876_26975 [Sphingobium sp. YC-XJ3]
MSDAMKMFVFEGTPAQLAEMAKSMGASTNAVTAALPISSPTVNSPEEADDYDGTVVVTTEFARKVLTRRPLSKEQRKLLVTLANATPDYTLATVLQEALDYSPAQFAGMMGAFGRRLTHTPHYVNDSYFFDQEWVHDEGCYKYRLPETVIAALKAEKIC